VDGAYRALQATLQWRRMFCPHLVPPEEIESENTTGKLYLNGFDRRHRPVIISRPHRQNSKDYKRQVCLFVLSLLLFCGYMFSLCIHNLIIIGAQFGVLD
jgi:hypothetical protein